MRKFFNLTSWILLFTLAPFAVLALLSQNTVPGDLFYPVKRGLEGIVLTAASASPATRVAFRTDLTERRFKEAQKLLLARADATALDSFILEVQSTQTEIDALSNVLENQQSSEKLIAKIDDYQVKLTQLQAQTQSSPQINQPQTVQQPQVIVQQQVPSPSDSGQAGQSAPLLQPTSPPQQPTVAVQSPPAQTAVASPEQQRVVSETIVTTKIELERIKKDLEEKKKEREEKKEEKREEREKQPERNDNRGKDRGGKTDED